MDGSCEERIRVTQSEERVEQSEGKLTGLVISCVGNCLMKHVVERKIEGRIEVTGRRVRRRKQPLDDLKEKRGYWILKEEALERTVWRTVFGRGCGPVIGQNEVLVRAAIL